MLKSYSHFHYEKYEKNYNQEINKVGFEVLMSRFYLYTHLRK